MDLTDQALLSIPDFSPLLPAPFVSASERYQPGAILAVTVTRRANETWRSQWLLMPSGSHSAPLQSNMAV